MVHDRGFLGDRVYIMVDINEDTNVVRRRGEVARVVRRRWWSDEEKGRIVAEAIAPGAVVADVAQQHGSGSAASIELDPGGQGWLLRAAGRSMGRRAARL